MATMQTVKYVGTVPAYYAAVCLELHNPNHDPNSAAQNCRICYTYRGRGTFNPILVLLRLLFKTDRQTNRETDGRTDKTHNVAYKAGFKKPGFFFKKKPNPVGFLDFIGQAEKNT